MFNLIIAFMFHSLETSKFQCVCPHTLVTLCRIVIFFFLSLTVASVEQLFHQQLFHLLFKQILIQCLVVIISSAHHSVIYKFRRAWGIGEGGGWGGLSKVGNFSCVFLGPFENLIQSPRWKPARLVRCSGEC